MRIRAPTQRVDGCSTSHDVLAELFGFPDLYGRNMDAWIDCASDIDVPGAGMSRVCVAPE